MAALAKQARRDTAIRHLAASLVSGVAPKDFRGEIDTIFNFVRDNIRYTQDINGVETIQYPINTLQMGYGDCDDMSTLLSSMLESIGHPCRFVAVAMEEPRQFDHVYVETKIGTVWVALDATENNPMGWEPPNILSHMIQFI